MANRAIYYTTTILRSFDLLWTLRDSMTSLGQLAQDTNGTSTTVVSGFAATPTSPTSLVINLTQGRIYQQGATDTTAFGSLASDADIIQQQGAAAAQTVTLTGSALSAGQSQWALIQATFAQVDVVRNGDPTGGVESYFNTANPSQPFLGPNNDGQPQPTERLGAVSISVVYGTPATTGAEVPPNPSAGNVPLYLIDLAFGQSTIASNQILVAGPSVGANVPSNYQAAPFFAGLLNSHHSGAPGQAPQIKMNEIAKVSSANSGGGISTMYSYAGNPNGHVAGVAAVAGVSAADFCLDITNNLLYFCSTGGNAGAAVWNPTTGQAAVFAGANSTGTANAQVVPSLNPGGFSLVSGYSVTFTPGVTNTGATNLQVLATANTACRKVSGGSLVAFTGGEFTVNIPVTVTFNGTFWVLQIGALGAVALLNIGAFLKNDGAGNLAVVNGLALGDDGTGKLTIVAGGVLPAMLSAAGSPLPFVAAQGTQAGENLTLSNDATNPNFEVDIAIGRVRDDSDVTNIQIAAALAKRLDQSWVGGTGNGACDTSTKGNNQTWHAFLIGKLAMVPTSYSRTSNIASLTIAGHGLGIGSTIRVYGIGGGFDGLQVVTAVTTNTLNYSNAGANVGAGSPPATGLADGFDALFSQSYASPTMPSGWTVKQCLGSVLTDGSANIMTFTQVGDEFLLGSNSANLTNSTPGNFTANNIALTVPLGVKVVAHLTAALLSPSAVLYLSSLDQSDQAPFGGNGPSTPIGSIGANGGSGNPATNAGHFDIRTNTSGQIRYRIASSMSPISIGTLGWRDPRRRLF